MSVEAFRRKLAESGQEFTPDQAEKIYKLASSIIKNGKRMTQLDLWQLEQIEIEGITKKEKKELIGLYQYVRELF